MLRVEADWMVRGWRACCLESPWLRVVVLPDKGADLWRIEYTPRGVNLLAETPWGLRPRGPARDFLAAYEGGWQLVFPNPGAPSLWQGIPFGQHDEVAQLPWTVAETAVTADGAWVTCTVDTERWPGRLRRTVQVAAVAPTVTVTTTLTHTGTEPVPGAVGEHLAFGPPFVGPGRGRLVLPAARTWIADRDDPSPGVPKETPLTPTDADRAAWAPLPPKGTPSRMWYLTDLPIGRYEVWAADGPWGVAVAWDPRQFPYLWYWGEFGAGGYPWWGRHYTVGLEPFTSWPTHGLAAAVANGSARWWAPGEAMTWTITLTVLDAAAPNSRA